MVCYCLISHHHESRILGIKNGTGWILPQIEIDDVWIAKQANLICAKFFHKFGLKVTVLRHLSDNGQSQICELENHDSTWKPDTESYWLDCDEAANLQLDHQGYKQCIKDWWQEKEKGTPPTARPPWEQLGWFATATEWINRRLDEMNEPKCRQIEQWKAAWPASCVLRIETPKRKLFFKAVYQKSASEAAIIAMLSQNWQKHVPQVISSDATNRWILMADFGDKNLESASDETRMESLGLFAEIQKDFVQRTDLLIRLGCTDMRSDVLLNRFEQLLNDDSALRPRTKEELNASQIAELRAAIPLIRAKLERLRNFGIPETIVQPDFRNGNIASTEVGCLFFDWSDTAIAHPFYCINRYLDYFRPPEGISKLSWRFETSGERRNLFLNSYLDKWTEFGTQDQLLEAFSISRQLNPVFLSVRWYNELSYYESKSPRGQLRIRSIPRELRNVLWVIRKLKE